MNFYPVYGYQDAIIGIRFWCIGCKAHHTVPTGDKWKFSFDHQNRLSISPSLVFENPFCHSFVTNGELRFLRDSKHEYGGTTVIKLPKSKEGVWHEDEDV